MFKKLTKKVVDDVKETVKEETQKTTEEIKDDVVDALKKLAPIAGVILGGLALILSARKPSVTVKVIVKQAI